MSGRYRVKTTRHAEQSVLDIVLYIAVELCAPEAADRIKYVLYDNIYGLNFMPRRVPLTPEEPWHSYGLRRMLIEEYYIYFWIDDVHQRVQVTDVVHVGMDQTARLETMPFV